MSEEAVWSHDVPHFAEPLQDPLHGHEQCVAALEAQDLQGGLMIAESICPECGPIIPRLALNFGRL